MPVAISLPVGPEFSFRSTVYSHGWSELLPYELDTENWRLTYVFTDAQGRSVSGVMSENDVGVAIELENSKIDVETVSRDARHMLRLDDDLTGFYDLISGHEHLAWVAAKSAGRLLRS